MAGAPLDDRTYMAQSDVRNLKTELTKAIHKGNHKKALGIYLELEKLQPKEGTWPQRAADTYQRLGKLGETIAALLRAATRYTQAGFLLKAIAVCKRVLALEPEHEEARQALDDLCAQHGIPAPGTERQLSAPEAQ